MNKSWSSDEDRRLLALKAEGYIFEYIGERLGRTAHAVKKRLRWLSMNEDERAHNRYIRNRNRFGKRAKKLWTAQETELAEKLIFDGASDAVCRSLLGKSRQACRDRVIRAQNQREGISNAVNHYVNTRIDIPPEVEADRDRRLLAQRSLTATLLGDPAPGFSALERRA